MPCNPAIHNQPLDTGWQLVRSDPGSATTPSDIRWDNTTIQAEVPGTVASSLASQPLESIYPNSNHDDHDWWYQCEFQTNDEAYQCIELLFEGLATIAEVWLNGESIHTSANMFREFRLDVTNRVKPVNVLSIVFRSINHSLKTKRPRPAWKTNLVTNQQLRWIRTTLLGRIPGWTPPIHAVGPWRGVALTYSRAFSVETARVRASARGTSGALTVAVTLGSLGENVKIDSATISVCDRTYSLSMEHDGSSMLLSGRVEIDEVNRWNPNGYGEPCLYDYVISVICCGAETQINCGQVGFRSVALNRSNGRVQFVVNDVEIFARGACWTTNDIMSLTGDRDRLRRILTLTQQAGVNMIRVGGTMVYESNLFYDLCDELGITVWQDFMFANMDYPCHDDYFWADVSLEVEGQVNRLRGHPCVIAYCGNSEIEQQAAMFGMTEEVWRNKLFYDLLPTVIERLSPGTPYFPSSPCEGTLPFHNSTGPSHYFGVGAYKQPFDDLPKSRVKFATECLAFSNFPGQESLREHFGTTTPAVHHPKWKNGVPRDSAAGWDFEDIRDHYIRYLYGFDAVELRYFDKEAYTALSQVVTGEVMAAAYDFWRSDESECSGALVWFLNDIVPGGGWGFIDSDGRPKPSYYFLRRSWNATTLSIRDLGMDGLLARLGNDSAYPSSQRLHIKVLQHSQICIAEAYSEIEIPPKTSKDVMVDELLGRFYDTTHRYRFGPSKHDVIVFTMLDENGEQMLTRCFYPGTRNLRKLENANIKIGCCAQGNSQHVTICSDSFLQHVRLHSRTHEFSENYFHLAPGIKKTVIATSVIASSRALRGTLSAINLNNPRPFK